MSPTHEKLRALMLKEIIGENKERDLDICLDYCSGATPIEILDQRGLKLTLRRVQEIIKDNDAFVLPRVAWPKSKRIHKMQKIVERLHGIDADHQDETSAILALEKVIEGDKTGMIDASQHTHLTTIVLAKRMSREEIDAMTVEDPNGR